jgi:FMN phosphatase YigB (HAD superfamily)
MAQIKNIIFDLGGVILNLDMQRTEEAFEALCPNKESYLKIRQELLDSGKFFDIETGHIHEDDFIQSFRQANPLEVTEAQVRQAWSAMLLDMPAERIEVLRAVADAGYHVYLLSNINSIHLADVYKIIQAEHGDLDFDALFKKPYYSHLIGHRKPNVETFEWVVKDAGVVAKETIFIDDNADNVKSAASIGLEVIHHPANSDLEASLRTRLEF